MALALADREADLRSREAESRRRERKTEKKKREGREGQRQAVPRYRYVQVQHDGGWKALSMYLLPVPVPVPVQLGTTTSSCHILDRSQKRPKPGRVEGRCELS